MSGRTALMRRGAPPPADQDESRRAGQLSQLAPRRHERAICTLLVALAVGFNLWQLYPEVAIRVPMLNDGVLHLLNVGRAVVAIAAGQDPTDSWLASINFGFPL